MLQSIRDKAQGWIAWVIVILITIPFALFGVQEYLGGGSDPTVAEVEGAKITESQLELRVRDVRENMRSMLGNGYRPEMFEGAAFQQQVLDSMIQESLLRQAASDWNMRASDPQVANYIHGVSAFQSNGQFDPKLYEIAVRNRGLSPQGFEDLVRNDLISRQMQTGIQNTAFITDSALQEQARLSEQQRSIEYVKVPRAAFADDSVSDADAQSYYDNHQQEFVVPEKLKLAYLRLDTDVLQAQISVDEDALETFYADHQQEFIPAEERKVRHILIDASYGDDAAQLAEAQKLRERLQAGADFAELAQSFSKDPGSAKNGGDLGWVSRGVMVAPFEESAFSLAPGAVSEPVKTQFGYHLLEVTDKRGGSDATFADVRDEVEQSYRKQEAEDLYFDYVERLADAVYESPDSLEPAADMLQLKVQTSPWVDRSGAGLPPALTSPKVINAAFSEDVYERNHNSQLIELAPADSVVVRIADRQPESVEPFDQVKEQIVKDLAQQQASESAASKGKELLQQLRAGAKLADLVAPEQWPVEQATIGRGDRKLPAELVEAAFTVAPPAADAMAYTGVVSAEGDYLVIQVDSIKDGGEEALSKLDKRRDALQAQQGRAEYEAMVEAIRARSKVEIN